MPSKQGKLRVISCDTAPIEKAFEETCFGNLQIIHRLELRRLTTSLWYDAEIKKQGKNHQIHIELIKALTNFKANLQRRKKTSDIMTSSRLMEITEPARAILLADIAYTLRDEIDDYMQIDFSNVRHVELLHVALDRSISKVSSKQGRPVNEPLDEFFIGLKALFENATRKPAVAGAHFDGQPKTDFEKLMYLGYQIIRPAYSYPTALKAYERATSRNS